VLEYFWVNIRGHRIAAIVVYLGNGFVVFEQREGMGGMLL